MTPDELNAEIKKLRDDISGSHLASEVKMGLLSRVLKKVPKGTSKEICLQLAEPAANVRDDFEEAKKQLQAEKAKNGNGHKPPLNGGIGNDPPGKPIIERNGGGEPAPADDDDVAEPIRKETLRAISDVQDELPKGSRMLHWKLKKMTEQEAQECLADFQEKLREHQAAKQQAFEDKVNTEVEQRTKLLQASLDAFECCAVAHKIDRATPEQLTALLAQLTADVETKEGERAALEAEIKKAGAQPGKLCDWLATWGAELTEKVKEVSVPKSELQKLTEEAVQAERLRGETATNEAATQAKAEAKKKQRKLLYSISGAAAIVVIVLGMLWGAIGLLGDGTASNTVPSVDNGYLQPLYPSR